jgi:predicted ribosome quality control (RQC) complex YloA/Tae2 family protein
MDNFYFSALIEEIRPLLEGRTLARISFTGTALLFEFRTTEQKWLRASFDPSSPSLYMEQPRRESLNEAHPFLATLRKELGGAKLIGLMKPQFERVVTFGFECFNTSGERCVLRLAIALTGRTANAYLLDEKRVIKATLNNRGSLRVNDIYPALEPTIDLRPDLKGIPDDLTETEIEERFFKTRNLFSPLTGKEFHYRCLKAKPAEAFASLIFDLMQRPPEPRIYSRLPLAEAGPLPGNTKTDLLLSHFPLRLTEGKDFIAQSFNSLSEAASQYDQAIYKARRFQDQLGSLKRLLSDEVKKRAGLLAAIESDKEKYAAPERFKQLGDLLLANLTTAQISENRVRLVDYYDPDQPEIVIDLGEGKTIQQAAAAYFNRFQKARRALKAIAIRESSLRSVFEKLQSLSASLNEEVTLQQVEELRKNAEQVLGLKKKASPKNEPAKTGQKKKPSGRWYRSPSGFEIVVGRNDKDNDTITFRLAGSMDVWMHAADYPGSHVVIRNPNRKEVPAIVIQEAAEIAAFYSQAKQQDKVAVHYTQKKFVSKPPRAKPGLVRLSSFKTILVEPRCILDRIDP